METGAVGISGWNTGTAPSSGPNDPLFILFPNTTGCAKTHCLVTNTVAQSGSSLQRRKINKKNAEQSRNVAVIVHRARICWPKFSHSGLALQYIGSMAAAKKHLPPPRTRSRAAIKTHISRKEKNIIFALIESKLLSFLQFHRAKQTWKMWAVARRVYSSARARRRCAGAQVLQIESIYY